MPKVTKKKSKEKVASKTLSPAEFEARVLELASKGFTSEKIGEALRQEGIHPKEHGKKISKILIEKGKYVSADVKNVKEKLAKVKAHSEKNKQDKRAMREKDRLFSQVRRLEKFYRTA